MAGPKRVLQGVSDDAQNGAYRSSVGRLKSGNVLAQSGGTGREWRRSEELDLLAQVRHHQRLVGKFRAFVLTTMLGQIILATVGFGHETAFSKTSAAPTMALSVTQRKSKGQRTAESLLVFVAVH
jgi:hypothetical protein